MNIIPWPKKQKINCNLTPKNYKNNFWHLNKSVELISIYVLGEL